jgi:hypothetical protein
MQDFFKKHINSFIINKISSENMQNFLTASRQKPNNMADFDLLLEEFQSIT